MCSHKQHKRQQMHKNRAPQSQVNVSQQEDPFTMGEEGMQDSCQSPSGLLGCTGCHCQTCGADLWKGWSWSCPCPPAPTQPWVHWDHGSMGHTQSTASRNSLGPNQRRKGCFCSIFAILFIVQRQHGKPSPWNHHPQPEPFSLFLLSPISTALYPFHCGPLNISWTHPQQKKKPEFLIRLMQSPRFTSSTVNQPSLKTLKQKVSQRHFAIFYWCRVFPR